MKRSNLQKRGSMFWFRCRVPQDLLTHYGKAEILRSLRTRDYADAQRLVVREAEQQQQEFDRIRAGRSVTELSDEQVTALWASSING